MKRAKISNTIQRGIIRLVSSWLLGLALLASLRPGGVFTKDYDKIITPNLPVMALGFFALITFLSLLSKIKRFDRIVLFSSSVVAGAVFSTVAADYVFTITVFVLICMVAVFCFKEERVLLANWDISKKTSLAIVAGLALCAFVFIGGLTILRFLSFRAPNFDFGIFVNMFHNMATKLTPLVSSERDMLLSHFAVHLSPIYYLLLPIYMVFPYPQTLFILQALAIVGGIIPLWLIAKKYKLNNIAVTLLGLVYLVYPAFVGGAFFDFHENKFLLPIILWLFYFYEN